MCGNVLAMNLFTTQQISNISPSKYLYMVSMSAIDIRCE